MSKFRSFFDSLERQELVRLSAQCLRTKEGIPGLRYLRETRHLSDQIIDNFSLGYLPTNLHHQLAGRIIIPLYDASHNLIAITSRTVEKKDNDFLPVYWHEKYEKSFYVYGLNIAKSWCRQWRFCIVVEGQIDCMRLHQYGFPNTVALCCHTLHPVQLATIHRYCDEIVLIFDHDPNQSGQKGVEKTLEQYELFEEKVEKFLTRSYNYKIANIDLGKLASDKMDVDLFLTKYGIAPLRERLKLTVQEMRKKYVL